jgi:hypothetical protein
MTKESGFDSQHEQFLSVFRLALGITQPPIQWLLGNEVYYFHPSSAEVKNVWSYTFMPHPTQYILIVWYLIKYRDSSAFAIYLFIG